MGINVDARPKEDLIFGRPADSAEMPWAHPFRRGWRFLMDELIQSVPEEDAPCEFDCRKQQCDSSEWATCERRLQAVAAQRRYSGRSEPWRAR